MLSIHFEEAYHLPQHLSLLHTPYFIFLPDTMLRQAAFLADSCYLFGDLGFSALCSKPADPEKLMKTLPIPGKPAPEAVSQNGGGEEVKLLLTNTPYNDKALNPPVLPVLISPKVVPQLAEMAQRLVAAGLHQQCLKTYRSEIGIYCVTKWKLQLGYKVESGWGLKMLMFFM